MNDEIGPAKGTPNGSVPPARRSLLRRVFRWRTLGMLIFLAAGLVTLAFLINAEENWRAARAWQECRKKLEAKGERLDLLAHLPPPVPPEQNFAMIPLLANPGGREKPVNLYLNGDKKSPGLGNWRTAEFTDLDGWRDYFAKGTNYPKPSQPGGAAQDVLTALSRFEPAFAELRAGALRPQAQFPIAWTNDPMALQMPYLAFVKGTAQAVKLHAVAAVAAERGDEALSDLRVNFKLLHALEGDPVMISFLVRVALAEIAVQPVWEGLATHRWNEAQLAALEAELGRLNLVADGVRTLRGERAFGNVMSEGLIRNQREAARQAGGVIAATDQRWPFLGRLAFPCWVVWRSQVLNNECQQDIIESLERAAADPARSPLLDPTLTNAWQARLSRTTPYNALAKTLVPVMFRVPPAACRAQAVVGLARTGCALERYRLAHGRYPEKTELLAPQFIDRVPMDPYVARPFRYRLEEDGSFLLYSVGANLADDGGKTWKTTGGSLDVSRGDLVWAYGSRR
jgi:hypothetical protein